MKRNVALAGIFTVASILNGCTAAPVSGDATPTASAASANSVQPQGMYRVQVSPYYTWLKMQDGLYGVWHAGDECNKDFSKAPSSCLDTGTYSFNDDLSEVTFIDDATGKSTTSPFAVSTVGPAGSSLTVQHTAVQPSAGDDSADSNSASSPAAARSSTGSDDQQPTVTAFNLRKCIQAITMACNLFIQDPSGTGSEPLPEPTIELPAKGKPTAQG